MHIGFVAPSHEHARAFWRAGTAAGHPDDGEPGPRPQYGADYFGAFLRDPDGNSAEAVHHDSLRADGCVDHLWIRVAHVAASKRFYLSIAARTGLELGSDSPRRAQFRGASGTFSLVAGDEPSAHVLMALAADAADLVCDPDGNTIELVPPRAA